MKYSILVDIYQEIESTTKTLEKTAILAKFLKKISVTELEEIILLLQGRAFPEYDVRDLGLGTQLAIKAISSSSGSNVDKVKQMWKKTGDLGETASQLIGNKKQATLFSKSITTSKVLQNLQKLAELEGAGTVDKKVSLLKELLSSASGNEAKYIIRTCLNDLRVGIGQGTLRDAISEAFEVDKTEVQKAYNQIVDFGEVAQLAKEGGDKSLRTAKITIGKPIKAMLYQKAADIENAFERVGSPAAFEYKFDGFMCQIHKKGDKVQLFTRNQEEVTKQFPDVVERVKKHVTENNVILDSEIVGIDFKTGNWLPFQSISQRIKRKYDIEETIRKIPVVIQVFDIMFYKNTSTIDLPFNERRKLVKSIIKTVKDKLEIAKQIITSSEKEVEKFYNESLAKGNEGVMAKNLEAEYKPGSRVGYGVKIKPIMEPLDLVIVGAEWGSGKRAGWLSSFILACRNSEGKFLEIGKMGTGIKEKEEMGTSFEELTKLLKPLIISESGKIVKVKPKIIVEVAYEEIQKSPTYMSGFALRFPRLIKLRTDRNIKNMNDLAKINLLYSLQRGRI
ncbi:ATP-dependent DNA ligase [Candidatus Woesearchaeota archaeon]|jgi:DNA ligase 1|nr:ATP-dependent DNA ligase [Candidatus Woesearchaeota archaeon]MBT7062503.1 ATP-dependent DNA ligase [Candidatus Woesearchaeota archaeon]MBT7402556.1 ATP-dependent DNA ligase [Candidatus Woesearchaeota archaeon]